MSVTQPISPSPGDLLTLLGQRMSAVWLASGTPGSLSVPRRTSNGKFPVHAALIFTDWIHAGINLPHTKATNAITIV